MRVLLTFSVAFGFGALIILLGAPLPLLTGAAILAVGGILALSRRVPRAAVVCLGLGAGLLWCQWYQIQFVAPAESLVGKSVPITGTALDYSNETAYGIRVTAEIQAENLETRAAVWLYTEAQLSPGDQFSAIATLKSPETETYDYRADGVYLLAYGQGTPEIYSGTDMPLRFLPRLVAHRLEASIRDCIPEDVAGYALALTTGNRAQLTSLQQDRLKTAGLYHALALSGLHMTTLIGLLSLLLPGKKRRAFLGIPLCILFTIVTGASPTLVRACVMALFLLTAPLAGREADGPTSLGAAGLVLILQNPWCLFDWGAQLSFASMAGILVFSEPMGRGLYDRFSKPRRKWRRKLRWAVISSFSATFSAIACTVPLMMRYFGQVSLVSPISNLLAGWMVSWCFRGSLLTGLAGILWPRVGSALGWCLAWGFRYIGLIAEVLAQIPFAALYTSTVYAIAWVILCYCVFGCVVFTPKERRTLTIPLCCVISGLAICITLSLMENTRPVFTMVDVGQGQCIIARVDGFTVMIDCGGSYEAGSRAASYLDSLGEGQVDLLILTHYDTDHVNGVADLMERVTVSSLLLPAYLPESDIREGLEAAARAHETLVQVANEDSRVTAGGMDLSIYVSGGNGSENNECLAVLLDMGTLTALVTGDMDTAGETMLLARHDLPDVDVLVAGHHGSKFSTSEALLAAVTPEVVAISVGRNNYGHPTEETLDRIAATGAVIYRTDQGGTLRIKGA